MDDMKSMPLPFGLRPVLASNSPRRRELLGMMVPGYRLTSPPDVDETYPDSLSRHEVPAYLSRLKAGACDCSALADNEVLVTADTVVICNGLLLGKPHSRREAVEMLSLLSGRAHEVVTGVTLTDRRGNIRTFSETTIVHFADIRQEDIATYVDTFSPYDKAGAYGIQEWIGAVGIRGVEGCFYNVIGLPLSALYSELEKFAAQRNGNGE